MLPVLQDDETRFPGHRAAWAEGLPAIVRYLEFALAACVLVVAAVVPLVFSSKTPYALDVKWLWSGGGALAAGAALLVWCACGGRLAPKTAAMVRILGIYLCAVVLSLACSDYTDASLRAAWWHSAHAILFVAAAVAFRHRRSAWAFVAVASGAATFVAVSGWTQAFGYDLFGTNWLKDRGIIRLGWGTRVLGTLGLETALGGYMAACAVLAIGALFAAPRARHRLLLGVAAFAMAGCMVWSGTRTAWFAFVLGLLVLLGGLDLSAALQWLHARAGRVMLGVAAAGIIALSVWLAPVVWARARNTSRDMPTRTTIWRSALNMFWASPVVGQGPGTFRIHFADFRPDDYASYRVSAVTVSAHCEYLEVLAETGMVGMVPFALFVGLFVLGSCRARATTALQQTRNCEDSQTGGPLMWPAFAASVALLIHAAFNVDTRYPTCWMLLWVLMGVTVARWSEGESPPRPVSWRRAALVGLPAAVVAALVAQAIWTTEIRRPYEARVCLRNAQDNQAAGRWGESIAYARRAIELDPISELSHYTIASSLLYAGKYEAALDAFAALRKYSPHFADADLRIAVLNALLGRMADARAALETARRYGLAYGEFAAPSELTDERLVEAARKFAEDARPR